MTKYLKVLLQSFFIEKLSLVSILMLSIEPYIVFSRPVTAMQNTILYSDLKAVKFRSN